jgi:hypothetical protein
MKEEMKMNKGYDKNSIKGASKYCFSVILKQHTKTCLNCKNIDPFIPLEDAVVNLLKKGYKLYAIVLLTEVNQCDIRKAKEHCDKLNIEAEVSYAAPIDDLIESLALNGNVMQAIKMVRGHQNYWGLKEAKEYVELMYLNKECQQAV